MSNMLDIISHRKIKSGKQYDNLIPKTSCKVSSLGSGDTYFTLEQMKIWAKKYQNQTKKLAKKLKSKTLHNTVTNIYNFLHDNLQYQSDGFKQNLRSPSCSWSSRKTGVDCKSYSLFASTLLLNLGINHSFRMIKQAGANPNEFSHVYVVIPTKNLNKYFVIDATVHINNEVPKLKKYDLEMTTQMPHYGLNGATIAQVNEHIYNFNEFLVSLSQNGVSSQVLKQIKQYVETQVAYGRDPFFKAVENGLWIDQRYFSFSNGLNGYGALVKKGVKFVGKFVDFKKVTGNFKQIFANGFDVTCWGASYSKSKATADIAKDFPFMLQESGLENSATEDSINKFSLLIDNYIGDAKNGTKGKFTKCTREGHQKRLEESLKYKKQIFDTLNQDPSIRIVEAGTAKGSGSIRFPGYVNNKDFNLYVYPYTVYKVQGQGSGEASYNSVSKQGQESQASYNGYQNQNQNQAQGHQVQTAGFGGGSSTAMYIGVAVAIGAILLLKK